MGQCDGRGAVAAECKIVRRLLALRLLVSLGVRHVDVYLDGRRLGRIGRPRSEREQGE
jgi:hypothetical protein